MTQRIVGKNHQITHKGNIINCHGGEICPYRGAPESQRQVDFARATGVWCPAEARELLEELMRDHGFTVRELAMAWKADSLGWDTRAAGVVVRVPIIEAIFGWSMGLLMITYYLMMIWPLWLMEHRDAQAMLAFGLASAILLGCTWLLGRFVLHPRRVALRVRRVLTAQ